MARLRCQLQEARDGAENPEHISNGPETHPSARLKEWQPSYNKVLHGSGIATSVGIARIRAECSHFDSWLQRIESLQPLR